MESWATLKRTASSAGPTTLAASTNQLVEVKQSWTWRITTPRALHQEEGLHDLVFRT